MTAIVAPTQYPEHVARSIVGQCEAIEKDRFGIEEDDPDVRSHDVRIRTGGPGRLDALVAVLRGQDDPYVVGFAYLDATTEREIYLDTLAVRRSEEGNGIGGLLLKAVDAFAEKRRALLTWLKVDAHSHDAERLVVFYTKHGYETSEEPSEFTDHFYGTTVMVKRYEQMYRTYTQPMRAPLSKTYGSPTMPAGKVLSKEDILRIADEHGKKNISSLLEGHRTGQYRARA
jgi:GNAT superfamily N-acetyltransferase